MSDVHGPSPSSVCLPSLFAFLCSLSLSLSRYLLVSVCDLPCPSFSCSVPHPPLFPHRLALPPSLLVSHHYSSLRVFLSLFLHLLSPHWPHVSMCTSQLHLKEGTLPCCFPVPLSDLSWAVVGRLLQTNFSHLPQGSLPGLPSPPSHPFGPCPPFPLMSFLSFTPLCPIPAHPLPQVCGEKKINTFKSFISENKLIFCK